MQVIGSILFTIFLPLCTLLTGVLALPALAFGEAGARRVTKFWVGLVLGGAKRIAGISFRIEGAEHLPKGGALVAVNHQSMWETLAFVMLLPKPVMIFKKELLSVPVYGWWAKAAGNIAVDREGGAKALRAMREAARAKIEEGCQIIVFPEGTRLQPGTRGAFQPGIAGIYTAAKAPATPVAHDSGRYWVHPGMLKKRGEISVKVLPPIAPGMDRKAFLRLLQEQIDAARPDLAAPTEAERAL